MPNIATALKEEITRLARKAVRAETVVIQKAASQYRSDIAALKKQVASLEKQFSRATGAKAESVKAPVAESAPKRLRFSAKRLQVLREKLGLSANDMGRLIGVSGQSIYKWEAEKARPRATQLAAIAEVRGLTKAQAAVKLAEMAEQD